MLRRLLGRIEDGRFGRALAGMQAGWQWECKNREAGLVEGFVRDGIKERMVVIERRGRGGAARCSCEDAVKRGVLCKHVAFAAMSELGLAAAARSKHRQLEELGR
ncbi:SWIM zinc finger family protein [Desulfotruncus alcoholivorax]|uniref:SWIM zinc finger family protein n=1 Tax=Desulfotruncus alcoholivorax TaxID=265477 RepID=UPI00040D77BA|nr:SWIM zinc finger family protein [Desulfotruncus alcoholivorax]